MQPWHQTSGEAEGLGHQTTVSTRRSLKPVRTGVQEHGQWSVQRTLLGLRDRSRRSGDNRCNGQHGSDNGELHDGSGGE